MSLHSIIIIEIVCIFLISWIINLTRAKKLYVGFSVIWFLTVVGLMTLSASPFLLEWLGKILGITIIDSVVAMMCYMFIFILIVLINLSKQVSILANNVTQIAQSIALEKDTAATHDSQKNA